MNRQKWDLRFLELAKHVASWSKDPSTQVGAVIVDKDKRVLSLGYNGFPRKVVDYPERYTDRDMKLLLVSHAERNALDNAHFDVTGATLYCTLLPCSECAKSIIQRGIAQVITFVPEKDRPACNWESTKLMFEEAGIYLEFYAE